MSCSYPPISIISEPACHFDLILDVRRAEFGKAVREDVLFTEHVRQPQGHRAGDLDLHQIGFIRQDPVAFGFALEPDVTVARGDVAVEGDPQVGIGRAGPRGAAVTDECLGGEAVAAYHIVDLGGDVSGDALRQAAAADVMIRFVERHRNAPLIDDPAVLLLDLEEHGAVAFGNAVGAEPQLFLVGGLFERGLDQFIVAVIEVDVADIGLAVFVDLHVG